MKELKVGYFVQVPDGRTGYIESFGTEKDGTDVAYIDGDWGYFDAPVCSLELSNRKDSQNGEKEGLEEIRGSYKEAKRLIEERFK